MKPGGTIDTRVMQNDLNEIQSGQFYAPSLIRLPFQVGFQQGTNNAGVAGWGYGPGGRPDLWTGGNGNPVLGNKVNPPGTGQILPTRIQLQQPCNSIQLIWHCLDEKGYYDCSYPLNTWENASAATMPLTAAPASVTGTFNQHWSFGWLRANGLGPWLPMSLMPSTEMYNGYMAAWAFGGFSSISGPMSYIDWIGYWDGAGLINVGPRGPCNYILALASANMSASSNRGSLGEMNNYAIPNGSGPQDTGGTLDTVRSKDVLVRVGSNGR